MDYTIITSNTELTKLAKYLLTLPAVAVDSENDWHERLRPKSNKLIMLQISDGKSAWLIDRRRTDLLMLKPLFENTEAVKIFHNSQHDCALLKNDLGIKTRNIYDTMNGEKLRLGVVIPEDLKVNTTTKELLYDRYGVSLATCLKRRGLPDKFEFENFSWYEELITCQHPKHGVQTFSTKEFDELDSKWQVKRVSPTNKLTEWTNNQKEYGVRDVEFLHLLMEEQIKECNQLNQQLTLDLENRVAEVFYLMTCRGFGVDTKGWLQLAEANQKIYDKAMAKLPAGLNWQAPGQACKYFGVKYIAELEALELDTPEYRNWKEARGLYNYIKTYGKSWVEQHVTEDSRVHCSFNQIINTGRCSSNNPNLQNVPSLTKTPHRTFFKPRPGNCFGIADFKGQELAIIAKGSGEPSWLDCLRRGEDLHSMCGEMVFKDRWRKTEGDARKKMRRTIKDVNFGIAYGMWYEKFALKADISIEEAQETMELYQDTFKYVIRWIEDNSKFTLKTLTSYSMPPFNRRRVVDQLIEPLSWRIRNIGKNNPVQGTGADMTKLAMVYMHQEFEDLKTAEDDGIIHQLHDELIVEWPLKHKAEMLEIMRYGMVRANTEILGEQLGEPDMVAALSWVKPD